MSPTSYTDILFFYDLKIPFAIWIGFFIGRRIIFMRPRLRSAVRQPPLALRRVNAVHHRAVFVLTYVRMCYHFATTYSVLNASVRF
jgi:hypothetical protein